VAFSPVAFLPCDVLFGGVFVPRGLLSRDVSSSGVFPLGFFSMVFSRGLLFNGVLSWKLSCL